MLRHVKEDKYRPIGDQTKRVLIDGEDITRTCFAFDVEKGIAYCYVMNAGGVIEMNAKKQRVHVEKKGVITTEAADRTWQHSPANISG